VSLPLHSQHLHARQPRQLRRHGAREVVVVQVPATTNLQVRSTIVQRDTQDGVWNEAYRYPRLVNIPTCVGMVPVRSLSFSNLQRPTSSQYPSSFNVTRRVEGGK
jgi:hypothetical protein